MRQSRELRHAEVRAGEGRILIGLALPYGVETRIGAGRERFEPDSIRSTGEAILNVHHRADRVLAREPNTLKLESRADGLHALARLPETREADDTLSLVRAGVLAGLSVEFRALRERFEGGVRVIRSAVVSGLAVVPRPAYQSTTVEARGESLATALHAIVAGHDVLEAAMIAGLTETEVRDGLARLGRPEPVSDADPRSARPGALPVWLLS